MLLAAGFDKIDTLSFGAMWRCYVNEPSRSSDLWRFPAFLLWLAFLLVGLAPEPVFLSLREWGGVLPQHAWINSHHLLTLVWAGYVGLFCYHRCRDAGLGAYEAQDRGLMLTLVALVAFLPLDFEVLFTAHSNPLMQYRSVVYGVGLAKCAAWWWLAVVFTRYYLFGVSDVFVRIPSVFPSTHKSGERAAKPAVDEEQDGDRDEDDEDVENRTGKSS